MLRSFLFHSGGSWVSWASFPRECCQKSYGIPTVKGLGISLLAQMVKKVKVKWKSLSCARLFAAPWTVVHRILQARTLEWVVFPFSRESSPPRDWTHVPCIAGGFFTSWATDGKESACSWGDPRSILESGRPQRGGQSNPLQYSCLENSMEEPGRLQPAGLQRVRFDWVTNTAFFPESDFCMKAYCPLLRGKGWRTVALQGIGIVCFSS